MRISGGIEKHGKRNYRVKVGFDSPEEAARFVDEHKRADWQVPTDLLKEPDIWTAFERLQEMYSALDSEKDEATVTLADTLPVMVVWTSDWHVGHQYCAMEQLRRDLQLLSRTPGTYAMLGGDLFNNVIATSPMGSQFEEMGPPRMQKLLVEQALRWLQGRVLSMILGNHEGRSIAADDFDPVAYFAKKIGAVYFGSFGLLRLRLGEQEYSILNAHKFRMSSSFNKTHAAKRMLDLIDDADIVFTAHKHDPAQESEIKRKRPRFYGAAGTYEARSRYGKSLGYSGSPADMPGVILFPGEKKFLGFRDAFTDGIHALWSYRRDFDCPCSYCRGPSRN